MDDEHGMHKIDYGLDLKFHWIKTMYYPLQVTLEECQVLCGKSYREEAEGRRSDKERLERMMCPQTSSLVHMDNRSMLVRRGAICDFGSVLSSSGSV